MTQETIMSVLEKIRIKSGLVGNSALLDPEWRVGFFYDREEKAFVLELSFRHRKQRVRLQETDVESRSRSQWMTDRTWRLTKQAIDRMSQDIFATVERTRAKMS